MEHGGSTIETVLVTDSMSLWSGVAAATVRVPTGKNLAVQLFWLREMLDKQVLTKFRWCDTRDMNADAHTKGKICREAILALMCGQFAYVHPVKNYVSPKPRDRKKYDPTAPGHCNHCSQLERISYT